MNFLMSATTKQMRVCKYGHHYFKSSDCPVCPVCEKERKPTADFMSRFSAPARRALDREGIKTLSKLASYKENDLLKLHGFGPTSLTVLRSVLANAGYKTGK